MNECRKFDAHGYSKFGNNTKNTNAISYEGMYKFMEQFATMLKDQNWLMKKLKKSASVSQERPPTIIPIAIVATPNTTIVVFV